MGARRADVGGPRYVRVLRHGDHRGLDDQVRAACHHLIETRLQDPSPRVKQKAAEIIELMQKSKKRQIIGQVNSSNFSIDSSKIT